MGRPLKWTRERVEEVISTCRTVKEFKRIYPGAFCSMKKNGWNELKTRLSEYHPPENKNTASNTVIHWTREHMAKVLGTCRSMNEFRHQFPGGYDAMKRNGWADLKAIIPNYTPGKATSSLSDSMPSLKWTREKIAEAVSTCSTRTEFRKKYDQAYVQLKKHGWTDLLSPISDNYTRWTKEKISHAITLCKDRMEFNAKYPGAKMAIQRNGWENLLKDLPRISMLENPTWSVYIWEFPSEHAVYIGLSKDVKRRMYNELRYSSSSPVHDFIERTGCEYKFNIIESGLYSNDAAELEIYYISKYRVDGYHVLNKNRGGSLGSPVRAEDCMSDRELLANVFSRFNSMGDLLKYAKKMYSVAKKRNIDDIIRRILPDV